MVLESADPDYFVPHAILGQVDVGVGTTPGAGGVQHLARLLGRGRAMEAILGGDRIGAL